MGKDPVLEKYESEGFGKNAFGWYFNPWISEYDEDYDPHNDKEYNEALKENKEEIKWHPKLTQEQIEELIAENIRPGDNEYDMYLWNHGIRPFEEKENTSNDVKSPHKEEPKVVEPKVIEPKVEEPKVEEPKVEEPKVVGPKVVEPKVVEPKVVGPKVVGPKKEEIKKKPIREVKIIGVSPIRSKIVYKFNDMESGVKDCRDWDKVTFDYSDEQLKNIAEIVKRTTKREDIDSISKALDPSILKWLASNNGNFNIGINDYIDLLQGKDTSFDLAYEWRNIYDSSLDYHQIKNLHKIIKAAKKLNPEKVVVFKDKLKDRFIGNIKKRLELGKKQKRLAPARRKRKIKGFNKTKKFFTKEPTIVTKMKNLGSNILTGVKGKAESSRNFFANKLKIRPTPIKEQNDYKEQYDEPVIGPNYILHDPSYYDEK